MQAKLQEQDRRHRSGILIRPMALMILVVAAVVGAGIWAGEWLLSRRSGKGLIIAHAALDFGEAWVEREFRWNLRVQNSSQEDIHVRGMRSSCGCVSFRPQSFSVAAGREHEVELTLDLSPRRLNDLQQPTWPFRANITAITEGGYLQPPPWPITGRVRNPFEINAQDLEPITEHVLGTEYVPRVIHVRSRGPLDDVHASYDPAMASVTIRRPGDTPGRFTLEVLPSSELPEGPIGLDVTLTARPADADAARPAEVSLPLVMRIVHELEAIPSGISFGPLQVGEEAERVLVLRSRLGRSVAIESSQGSAESVVAVAFDEMSGSEARCRVFCKAVKSGFQKASIEIAASVGDAHKLLPPLVVPVSYVGYDSKGGR